MSEATTTSPPLHKAVFAFTGHALAAAAIFVILAIIAFGLGKFVHLLSMWGLDQNIVTCLGLLEYVLFAGDVGFLLLFLYSAMKVAYKEVRNERAG